MLPKSRKSWTLAYRSPSLWAAATSSAASREPHRALTASRATRWVCLPRSSTRWHSHRPSRASASPPRYSPPSACSPSASLTASGALLKRWRPARLPSAPTDTGSTLRAIEVEADVMLKGTRVDGIYTADPEKDPTATKFDRITYDEIYNRGLKVMDMTATVMARDNKLPIHVFNMDVVGNLRKVMSGEPIGTVVTLE